MAEVTGATGIVGSLIEAVSSGNWWLASALVVYALIEIVKGRIPGTNIKVPAIPAFIEERLGKGMARTVAFALSALLAAIYYIAGVSDNLIANSVLGWLASMGLHDGIKFIKQRVS